MNESDNPHDYDTDPDGYLLWDENYIRGPLLSDDDLRRMRRFYSEEQFELRLGVEWRKRGITA